VLLAGSKQHVALASVEGNVGLNVAAGILQAMARISSGLKPNLKY
jgi:hypothetical protein